jgi:NAD(P)-dependent dehydrogenase (short-subunit alcohol dehydrogenase family)
MVTGAASGIGRATALALADEGCHLVICDIQKEALKEVAHGIEQKGRQVLSRFCDVSKEKQMQALAKAAFERFGKVDIAMSNAGVMIGGQSHLLESQHWSTVLGVNLWGAIYTLIYFVRPMVERREGHWVVTASGMGLTGMPFAATYATSKFALVGLTESIRPELALHNVGLTTLCPGVVRTPIFETSELIGFQDSLRAKFKATGSISPEKFAGKVIKGIKKNKGIMTFSILTHTTYGLKRLSPLIHEKGLKQFAKLSGAYLET